MRHPIESTIVRGAGLVGLLGAWLLLIAAAHRAPAEVGPPRVQLIVTPSAALPHPQVVQLALEHELGLAVQLGGPAREQNAVLSVRAAGQGRAAVGLVLPSGQWMGRVTRLPTEKTRAAETIALLAATLLTDEAGDLLASLRHPSTPPVARPVPAPLPAIAAPLPEPPTPAAPAVLLPAPATATELPCSETPSELHHVPFAFDAVPGVGWPPPSQHRDLRHVSLGLIGTISAGLDGIAVAPVFHIQHEQVRGVQASGAFNLSGGSTQGIQASGGVNLTAGNLRGVQGGGGVNIAGSMSGGLQGAPVNIVHGDGRGMQGGVVNIVGGDFHGMQAGVVNIAGGKVRGVQLGLVNLGEDADAGVGLLSLYSHGRTQVAATAQTDGLYMGSIKHGSRLFHNIFEVGAREEGGAWHPVAAFGFGGHLRVHDRVAFDFDGVHSVLIERDIGRNFPPSQLSQLRLTVGLRLLGPIGIFAGPVWNVAEDFSATSGDYRTIFGHGAAGVRTWFESADHAMRVRAWPGVLAGITLFGY